MIFAIDPGKDKCGLAILDDGGKTLEKMVVARGDLAREVISLAGKHKPTAMVMGKGTFSREAAEELQRLNIAVSFIDEKDSTRQARQRYWRENPPSGLLKFIPASLRTPPRPVDDYAAVILGERYLNR